MSNDKVVDSFNIFTCSERGHIDPVRFNTAESGEFELNMSNHKIDIQQGQFFRLTLTKFNMLKNYLNVNSSNDRFFLHTVDINGVERNKEVCLKHGDFRTVVELQVNFIYSIIRALGPICVAAGSAVEKIVPVFPIDELTNMSSGFVGSVPPAQVIPNSPNEDATFIDLNANLYAKELNFGLGFFEPGQTPTDHKLNNVQVYFFDKFVSGPSDCYKLMGGNRLKGFPPLNEDGTIHFPFAAEDNFIVSLLTDVDPPTPGNSSNEDYFFPNSALAGGGAFQPEIPPDSDSDDDSTTGNDTDPPSTAPPPTDPPTTAVATDPPTGGPPATSPGPIRTSMTFKGFHPMHLRTDQAIYLRTSLGSVTKNLESSSLSEALTTRQNETHVHHSNIFAKLTPQFNNDNDYVNFESRTGQEFFMNLYNLKHLNNIKFQLTDSHGIPLQALSANPISDIGQVIARIPPVLSFEMVLRVDIIEKNARNEKFTQRPNPGIDPKFSAQITTEQGLIRDF